MDPSGDADPCALGRHRCCPVCGLELGRSAPPDRTCPNQLCSDSGRYFSVAFPLGAYAGRARGAIYAYKYRGERWLSGVFADMLVRFLDRHQTWFEEFSLLVATPCYLGPGARRSWDPLASILGELSGRCGPGWQTAAGLVRKVDETPAMTGMGAARRKEIASGPLRRAIWVDRASLPEGARVLVLDDVLTDGWTLNEVSRALVAAGASEVAGLVLARTPLQPSLSPCFWGGWRLKSKTAMAEDLCC